MLNITYNIKFFHVDTVIKNNYFLSVGRGVASPNTFHI